MAAQKLFQDNLDATKQLDFDVEAVATGTSRKAIWPNADVDFRALKTQTFVSANAVTWNWAAGSVATLVAGHNAVITITNPIVGFSGKLKLTQDATGNRDVTFSYVGGVTVIGTIQQSANAITYLDVWFTGSSMIAFVMTAGTSGLVRVTAVNTAGGPQSVTFDGTVGETRVYRQAGIGAMTINAGAGKTFVGGGTSVVSTVDQDTITLTLNGSLVEILSVLPSGSSTNLGQLASPTNIVISSDTGTSATLAIATAVNAGLIGPAIIHSNTPSAALPLTADRIGQIFVRTGGTLPGIYVALDLVGNWNGPLG